MINGWMVRAGKGGKYFNEFKDNNYVAVGWNNLGPLDQFENDEQRKAAYIATYGNEKPSKTANAIGMIRRFGQEMKKNDWLVTYCPQKRNYLIGKDRGEFQFIERDDEGYRQIRKVDWLGEVSRDRLSQITKTRLGSTLTLFSLKDDVISDLLGVLKSVTSKVESSKVS